MDVSPAQIKAVFSENKTATGLTGLSALILSVLTAGIINGWITVGPATAGEYASKADFSRLLSTVGGNSRAIEGNTAAVAEVTKQVGEMYEQNLGQNIFQQTKIMCGLAVGSAIRNDYASRVSDARSLFTRTWNRNYPALSCADLAK